MNLYEKLNRLDDSLVESKRVVKKKKLTENLSTNEYKIVYHQNTACRDRRPETVDDVYDDWTTSVFRADSTLDAWKEAFERVKGNSYDDYLDKYANEEDFINYFEESDWGDGSPILIKLSSSNSDLYDTGYTLESWIDQFVEQDYDDDIDEMLTESSEQYDLSTLVKDSINHLVNDLGKDSMADDFGDDVCADLENNYDIYVPQNPVKYADWCDAVMSEVSRQLNNKEELTENRNSHYSAPYGYKDAAKVLNRNAPEYYYHRDEIQMAEGDGIKLARYAMKKGLPVMIYKYSDPDYPEFAIKDEYHWDDYFYFYPTAHEEDFVAWDGKMFVEEQLTEAELTNR